MLCSVSFDLRLTDGISFQFKICTFDLKKNQNLFQIFIKVQILNYYLTIILSLMHLKKNLASFHLISIELQFIHQILTL